MRKLAIVLVPLLLMAFVVGAIGCGGEGEPTPTPTATPTPTPTGVTENFRLLISDDANVIEEFEHLYANITSVGLHYVGASGTESGEWLEFSPYVEVIDLRQLVGEQAQEIWSGNVPAGNYTKVFIYVSDVWGNLTNTDGNETVDVKLPSNKLQISKPFVVTNDSVTSFVFDVAVVATGSEQDGVKYILKPQIASSGAGQKFQEIAPKGKSGKPPKPGT